MLEILTEYSLHRGEISGKFQEKYVEYFPFHKISYGGKTAAALQVEIPIFAVSRLKSYFFLDDSIIPTLLIQSH